MHEIGETAVAKHAACLLREILAQQYPRDLLAMRTVITATPAGSLPPALAAVKLLPDSLLGWLKDTFSLTPHLESGHELEVPVSRLATYDHAGDIPEDPSGLVRIRIISPGWKVGAKLVMRPQVEILR